jgi:hypothetical protein
MNCVQTYCEQSGEGYDYYVPAGGCCVAPVTDDGLIDLRVSSSYTKIEIAVCNELQLVCQGGRGTRNADINGCYVTSDYTMMFCQGPDTISRTQVRVETRLYESNTGYIVTIILMTLIICALAAFIVWKHTPARKRIIALIKKYITREDNIQLQPMIDAEQPESSAEVN